jgi:hypothetical protein
VEHQHPAGPGPRLGHLSAVGCGACAFLPHYFAAYPAALRHSLTRWRANCALAFASFQGNQTLLVPIDSSYPAHFGANTTTAKLAGYVLYNVIPGQFPTHTLHNLQRLYGRLPGVDVAVKIPRVHAGGHIQILGIYGNTIGRIVHKNLTACGSVYIHLLDAPVLPYTVK